MITSAFCEGELVPTIVRALHRRPGLPAARFNLAISMEAISVLNLVKELHSSERVWFPACSRLYLLHTVYYFDDLLINSEIVLVERRLLAFTINLRTV